MLQEKKRFSTIVLTKADCLNSNQLKDMMIKIGNTAAKSPITFPTIFATSSKIKYGIKELQTYLIYSILNKIGLNKIESY